MSVSIIDGKKILILKGDKSTGKTSTLLRVCSIFQGVADESLVDRYNEYTQDCHGRFIFGSKVVCICTAGDNSEEMEDNLDFISKNNAHIGVVALSSSGRKNKSEKAIEEFIDSKNYQYETIIRNEKKSNAEEAVSILKRIIYIGDDVNEKE